MKKRLLALILASMLLCGCSGGEQYDTASIDNPILSGDIGSFSLLTPFNTFETDSGFTFTWEEASNASYYSIEISADANFINDRDAIYVKENNISQNSYELNYTLPVKDIVYYWRVTAKNKDHTKMSNEVWEFKYNSIKGNEIPIEIEDEQDWTVHKEGSEANVSIDRNYFFGK